MAIHSSSLAWESPWTEELVRLQPTDRKELDTTLNTFIFQVMFQFHLMEKEGF